MHGWNNEAQEVGAKYIGKTSSLNQKIALDAHSGQHLSQNGGNTDGEG